MTIETFSSVFVAILLRNIKNISKTKTVNKKAYYECATVLKHLGKKSTHFSVRIQFVVELEFVVVVFVNLFGGNR